ncbi:MAG: 50S ribosome-binding GTPase [Nanoarchaeota archaeon]|nr:50S ribosome-binding GTPase [Nanoarchaeota archaeon]MBU1703938.1 50S ribosome-binding GTPase [Nanoarchaeota archaeon]
MTSFWSMVNKIVAEADVLLLVLDARMVIETRNEEIERKILATKKPMIYVITKCDLVEKNKLDKHGLKPAVLISSKKYEGTRLLSDEIYKQANKAGIDKEMISVGVLGYPNVGKSSLINAMKGRKSAPTSAMSGYTRGIAKIRAGGRIMMIDTPGVIPAGEKDFMKHALIGTLDFTKTQEPDLVVMRIMQKFPGLVEDHYGVKPHEDHEETIDEIALKLRTLKKGGKPDTQRMARMILTKWQKGDIRPKQ